VGDSASDTRSREASTDLKQKKDGNNKTIKIKTNVKSKKITHRAKPDKPLYLDR
jgi:hypothetical protein